MLTKIFSNFLYSLYTYNVLSISCVFISEVYLGSIDITLIAVMKKQCQRQNRIRIGITNENDQNAQNFQIVIDFKVARSTYVCITADYRNNIYQKCLRAKKRLKSHEKLQTFCITIQRLSLVILIVINISQTCLIIWFTSCQHDIKPCQPFKRIIRLINFYFLKQLPKLRFS